MHIEIFPVIWRIVTVWIATGILFFFFYKFFWKHLMTYMKKREDYIVDNVESATQANQTAQEYEKNANEVLKQARIDSKTIIDRSKNEAIKARDEIVDNAHKEARDKLDGARIAIEREKQQARNEIEGEVVDIALSAAREIVKDSIDEKKSEEIVDEFIKELKA